MGEMGVPAFSWGRAGGVGEEGDQGQSSAQSEILNENREVMQTPDSDYHSRVG